MFKVAAVSVVAALLLGCVEHYPGETAVTADFNNLVPQRVPSGIEVRLTQTYRGDGDAQSFSQVVLFDVTSHEKVNVGSGWLKGMRIEPDVPLKGGQVELIYHRQGDKWLLASDGLTRAPR